MDGNRLELVGAQKSGTPRWNDRIRCATRDRQSRMDQALLIFGHSRGRQQPTEIHYSIERSFADGRQTVLTVWTAVGSAPALSARTCPTA